MEIRDFRYRDIESSFDECLRDWHNRDENSVPDFTDLPAAFLFRDMAATLNPITCIPDESSALWTDADGDVWASPDGDGWEAPTE